MEKLRFLYKNQLQFYSYGYECSKSSEKELKMFSFWKKQRALACFRQHKFESSSRYASYSKWRHFRLAFFSLFNNFKGTKPIVFARDPILFSRLFEKASKNLNHINFLRKIHHRNIWKNRFLYKILLDMRTILVGTRGTKAKEWRYFAVFTSKIFMLFRRILH